jgi:hypothetical protein
MPTLILSPRHTSDSIALWQAAIAEGWSVERLQGWRMSHADSTIQGMAAIYGEQLFAVTIADQLSLVLLGPSSDWLTRLPSDYAKRQIILSRLGALRDCPLPAFIKPADDKCFTAQVYRDSSQLPEVEHLPPETPVLIAEPVTWQAEFRCFVLHRRVVAASVYSRYGEAAQADDGSWPVDLSELGEATDFAQRVLKDTRVALPPSLALDVGTIESRGWAVVEANPAWASGVYGCDPRQVLYAIAESCKRPGELTTEETQWVVNPVQLA